MGWRDMLAEERRVLPWLGGRMLRLGERSWQLDTLPQEYGWWDFVCNGRSAAANGEASADLSILSQHVRGYLVGDRVVDDKDPFRLLSSRPMEPNAIFALSETVHLLPSGLDRFARISAGRWYENGPLVFVGHEFPLGPETDVLAAFLEKQSIEKIRGVTPGLRAAFWLECWQRDEVIRRREAIAKRERYAAEAFAREAKRQEILARLGDGSGRREMAVIDFGEAARSALSVSGATLLDVRASEQHGEHVVRFRLDGRRFECVCDTHLRIVDSGICLTAGYDDPDFEDGIKGDGWFTLESLPAVIREAVRDGKLHVYRHV